MKQLILVLVILGVAAFVEIHRRIHFGLLLLSLKNIGFPSSDIFSSRTAFGLRALVFRPP